MGMHSESPAHRALQVWQSRQRADGSLLAVLVLAAVIVTLRFAVCPGPDSAWLMGIVLVALGMACLRLLNSASMVIRIREACNPAFAPEIIEAEILDVYEHPCALDAPGAQCTSTFWLSPPGDWAFEAAPQFSSQLKRIGQGAHSRARNRGWC
jgi:hypothetical protein